MDIIFLSEVKIQTRLGVPDWERMVSQTILLDIEIAMPNSASCATDEIGDTIDYGVVEALAEHLCQLIITEFKAPWIKIKVAKPGILPGVKSLGVVIERGSKST